MTTCVHELISHSVQHSPEAIALQIKNIRLSYAQLNEKVAKVSQDYISLDITQGDRIGIYLVKNQENVQSIFACSLLGAVFVPINPELKAQQVHNIANPGNFGQVIRRNYPVAMGNKFNGNVQELIFIVGSLCTPLDILADKVMLLKASLRDYVVVFQSGASATPKDLLNQPQVSEVLL